ncbi:TonB-dependent receptor [Sphingorhabdus sp. SMR4y]|uniref:TonB-dependent receptor n=1 Tax=Sphingorhabdus sp. SMR4y TaxID=2584094 RepID=UPI000B5C72DF|nr:TonB-dependent receptor [Sphingorhabdus sp. SMR4y]ASK87461.1 colicin I receptor [Sphingorhabdus sp. SMR4y]
MRKSLLLAATAISGMSVPAMAQGQDDGIIDSNVIIVTAQRQAQSAQDVPIAVSAFSQEALEAQQIENSSDLQLTLPNITFTKTNFTSSSFTIRGIGDLCVGVSCDQATAIHLNDQPLFSTRLFETEFFDLERVEVLRGPQGTLFGRNATAGVVNVVTAKPNMGEFQAAGDVEYGNYNALKVKGMVNLPIGDSLAFRGAGIYVKRDGYTTNLNGGPDLDDRELYSIRGSLRFEPGPDTTIDLMASYFREDDNRMRIQKQYCQRDETGILGCLNNRRDAQAFNANATFTAALSSQEFLATQGIPTAFALGSLYGPDQYEGIGIPSDPRTVNTAFTPEYFTSELTFQGKIEHDFGPISAQLSGTYQKVKLDSRQDYNNNIGRRDIYAPALNTLAAAAAGLVPGLPASYFAPLASAIIPNGPNGVLCTSDTDTIGLGSFGGNSNCATTPLQYDRSNQQNSSWSAEAIISSDLDGPFNFLLGAIYADYHLTENSYYVNAFAIDYVAGLLGSFTSLGGGLDPSYLGTPYFRNNTDDLTVKSYGLFGEVYFDISDSLKLTGGLRYNNDKKNVQARSTLASFLVPYSQTTNAFESPFVGSFDADPGTPGNQIFQNRQVKNDEITGRAVLDYKISDDNLVYISYSRGYKSGGLNPPLQPIFEVPESFRPEQVDAFEFGSKNTFGNGALQLNLTAFYYKYKDLQLSKIVARTAVNENIDADIYGAEIEAIIRPDPDWMINMGFSYLHTEVKGDTFNSDPRDFGGGRSDAVIIKDITNASNCAVTSTSGNAAGVNAFVNSVNGVINAGLVPGLAAGAGLQPTVAFPADGGIASTGAFGICGVLEAAAAGAFAGGGLDPAAFGGIEYFAAGVPKNIRGNDLPQAPKLKFSVGVQYTMNFDNGMSLVPRVDLAYTGESYGSIFNGNVNRIDGYAQANAQIQLNGTDDRWYVRGFVQNIFDSNSETGLYVTDQSSGLYTNVFTLEPRRYGIGAGFKF